MAYTNSSMVVYTNLSPNHSGQRTHGIERITPHCVVGQVTAEGLGEWFSKKGTQASSNYGIDRDGRVGLYVEEKNRAWTSSSKENDQRAVTIECASDTAEPYAFRDIVYQRLIELCADICRRNGKKRLLWLVEKEKTLDYKPKDDEMILTVHRWFAKKSCPGDWMYARMGELAEKVTEKLREEPAAVPASDPVSECSTDPEQMMWDWLMERIGNAYGVAGLMGNLYAESGYRANNLQNSAEKRQKITDEDYTALVDSGHYRDFVTDRAGYGLAQWTYWSRKQALLDFAREKKKSIGDTRMQLEFLMKELREQYPTVLNALKSARTVREASDTVLLGYEKPADQSETVRKTRVKYGEEFYGKYYGKEVCLEEDQDLKNKGNGNSDSERMTDREGALRVRVKVQHLNIRTGPGTNFGRVRFIPPGVYTIVEEREGTGAMIGWGKLKSGEGWICLDYVERMK